MSASAERLRTPTSLFRWLLAITWPTLVAVGAARAVPTGPVRTITLGVVVTAAAVLLVRVGRIEARVTPDGIRVRNPFRGTAAW